MPMPYCCRCSIMSCMPCREWRVDYVVAPYEADAQLAHLASLPEAEGGVAAGVCGARLTELVHVIVGMGGVGQGE